VEGCSGGIILRFYPGSRLDRLRKIMKPFSQDSRSPDSDLNPGLPEYEAGALNTRLR
jgi:hypothetical protein